MKIYKVLFFVTMLVLGAVDMKWLVTGEAPFPGAGGILASIIAAFLWLYKIK